jgi:hypothetical protein
VSLTLVPPEKEESVARIIDCLAKGNHSSIIALAPDEDDEWQVHISDDLDKFTAVGALVVAAIHTATTAVE